LTEEQETQPRNVHHLYGKIEKHLTEKKEQYKKEKQQLEMHLIAQDMEVKHLKSEMSKLQEAQNPEAEAADSDMTKTHLQRVEQEIFELKETVKKQAEAIEQLEKKLLSEDKGLVRPDNLLQPDQEFFNNFREMYTTSVMSQLELRIQNLESKISEMKIQTHDNVMVLENYNKLHESQKLRETEAQLKEVTLQFFMLIQHNMSLLNVLSSVLASECPCVRNFHRSLGSQVTQENMVTPASSPQSSKQYVTANLGVSADDKEDFNNGVTEFVLRPQPELNHTKRKLAELAKEKALSKKCFKWTKISTEHENGEHSFSDVSNTKQFPTDSPIDVPTHEIIAEDEERFSNILGNHDATFISPRDFKFTNLQIKHSKETTHQALYKAESKQYEDSYIERVEMTNLSSHEQLRSKGRQDEAIKNNFENMEPNSSVPNICMKSPALQFKTDKKWGHCRSFKRQEPLIPSSRPQPFAESLASFLNRIREENQQTSYDIIGNHKASCIRPQEFTLRNLQSKQPEELTHQTSYKVEPKQHKDSYLEIVEMTKSLSHEQLKSEDRKDEAMRNNFEKMELYHSAPNTCMASPALGFAAGRLHNRQEHSRHFIQGEPLVPHSGPWHFVESLDDYLSRMWQQLYNDYY
ncbi:hypothetical protein HispidOSU_004900, partial [Sigmodon hispidus]